MKLITIIPHYNSLDKLGDALFSIQNQSIKPNKIFIYDDSSTNVSKNDLNNLVKKYKLELELIFLEKNIGQSNIRIKSLISVLRKFNGEMMIHYLDADDMIHQKFYEYSFRLYSKSNKVISYSYNSFSKSDSM